MCQFAVLSPDSGITVPSQVCCLFISRLSDKMTQHQTKDDPIPPPLIFWDSFAFNWLCRTTKLTHHSHITHTSLTWGWGGGVLVMRRLLPSWQTSALRPRWQQPAMADILEHWADEARPPMAYACKGGFLIGELSNTKHPYLITQEVSYFWKQHWAQHSLHV